MPRPGAVIVSLNGGVGNQLFQYCGRAWRSRRSAACRCKSFPAGRSRAAR